MNLYWTRYSGHGKPQHRLLLYLGKHNGKIVCLDVDNLSDQDKQFLRSKSAYMDKLSLSKRIDLLRELRPHIMKQCKTMHEHNVVVDKIFEINGGK